jgi:hypothetical protein
MILLDKSEYDKVAEELAAEGFFKRFEEKYGDIKPEKSALMGSSDQVGKMGSGVSKDLFSGKK